MRFYLKRFLQSGGALFTVYNELGDIAFLVTGVRSLLSAKMSLRSADGVELARITGMGTSSLSKFSIEIPGEKRMTLIQSITPGGISVSARNPNWSFRGDPALGNFDVIDVDRTLVMTHGAQWKANGSRWYVQIENDRDIVRCLCICAVVDGLLSEGEVSFLPAKGS